MNLEEEIKIYGAKGAVLKYIHETDNEIPIEPFVLVPVGENWRNYETNINKLGKSLVRSSSPLEDGKRLSFAGLFGTEEFRGQESIDAVLESMKSEDTLDYIRNNKINERIEMGLTFHKKSSSSWNWSMLRHPHQENIIFISGRPVYDPYSYSGNFVFDETKDKLEEIIYYSTNEDREVKFPEDIREATKFYKKIESMPAFQNEFTYQMEFGTNSLSIYQFRPFRKIEKPSWNLESQINKKEGYHYPIVFGITPPEGIELITARALTLSSINCKIINELMEKFSEDKVQEFSKSLDLNELERIYAEELSRDLSNFSIRNYLDRAISKINSISDKEKTILFQEDIHDIHGRDIDLLFPNAKSWIADNGYNFLSHNLFRAMQYYDICLIGQSILKTGDKVRVFSDGIKGMIVRV